MCGVRRHASCNGLLTSPLSDKRLFYSHGQDRQGRSNNKETVAVAGWVLLYISSRPSSLPVNDLKLLLVVQCGRKAGVCVCVCVCFETTQHCSPIWCTCCSSRHLKRCNFNQRYIINVCIEDVVSVKIISTRSFCICCSWRPGERFLFLFVTYSNLFQVALQTWFLFIWNNVQVLLGQSRQNLWLRWQRKHLERRPCIGVSTRVFPSPPTRAGANKYLWLLQRHWSQEGGPVGKRG